VRDICAELVRPGRDPRALFEPPKFRDDVMVLEDVKEGMVLEGVVTNVAAFGAFVDVGVHQDGLIHVSRLASRARAASARRSGSGAAPGGRRWAARGSPARRSAPARSPRRAAVRVPP
jgi:hypothetical protein